MTNEVVKYHHELNTTPLRKFTPAEMDLFFSVVSRMREKGDKTVRLTLDQLKNLGNYKATVNNRFINNLEMACDKLMDLRSSERNTSGFDIDRFVMFSESKIHGTAKDPYVDI